MSNSVNIVSTEFRNIKTGDVSKGVRVYDDYRQAYDNTWGSIPDDDLEILEMVKNHANPVIRDLIDFLQEMKKSVTIDGTYYDWDEIEHLWE